MSASLMARSTTFRRACAAAALGHSGPLRVNLAASSASKTARRLPVRDASSPGEIPALSYGGQRTVGKNLSAVSRRVAIAKWASRANGRERVVGARTVREASELGKLETKKINRIAVRAVMEHRSENRDQPFNFSGR